MLTASSQPDRQIRDDEGNDYAVDVRLDKEELYEREVDRVPGMAAGLQFSAAVVCTFVLCHSCGGVSAAALEVAARRKKWQRMASKR